MRQKKKKKNRIRPFVALLVLIGLVLFVVSNRNNLNLKSIFRRMSLRFVSSGEDLTFEVRSKSAFADFSENLAVVSGSGVQVIDKSGNDLVNSIFTMSRPAHAVSDKLLAVYDAGSTSLKLIHTSGQVTDLETVGAIISVSVNDSGWMAVTTQKQEYRGSVTVYNNKQVEKGWGFGKDAGYPLAADVFGAGKGLVTLSLNGSGSRVAFFQLNSDEEKAHVQFDDEMFFDVHYLSSDIAAVIGEKRVCLVSNRGEVKGSVPLDGYLQDFSPSGTDFLAIAESKYRTGGLGGLITVNAKGEMGRLAVDKEILAVSAAGRYLSVLYSDKMVIYNSDLNEYAVLDEVTGVQDVLMHADGSALIIYSYYAKIFSP